MLPITIKDVIALFERSAKDENSWAYIPSAHLNDDGCENITQWMMNEADDFNALSPNSWFAEAEAAIERMHSPDDPIEIQMFAQFTASGEEESLTLSLSDFDWEIDDFPLERILNKQTLLDAEVPIYIIYAAEDGIEAFLNVLSDTFSEIQSTRDEVIIALSNLLILWICEDTDTQIDQELLYDDIGEEFNGEADEDIAYIVAEALESAKEAMEASIEDINEPSDDVAQMLTLLIDREIS